MPSRARAVLLERSGVDLTRVREVVLAGYPQGRLLLLRGGVDAPVVVARAAGAGDGPSPASQVLEGGSVFPVWTGHRDSVPALAAALAQDTLLYAEWEPPQARALLNYLQGGGVARPPSALAGLDQRALVARVGDRPMAAFWPLPLGLPADSPAGALLARERCLGLGLGAVDSAVAAVDVELRAELPPGASANLERLVQVVARDPLGASLGLLPDGQRVDVFDQGARLTLRFDMAALSRGLPLLLAEAPWLDIRSAAHSQ